MKIKTSELQGAALDWAVLVATGSDKGALERMLKMAMQLASPTDVLDGFHPSTDYRQGGPLIAKHLITVTPHPVDNGPATDMYWAAFRVPYGLDAYPRERWGEPIYGKTYLEVAMRALAASKLGAEIDVPGELADRI